MKSNLVEVSPGNSPGCRIAWARLRLAAALLALASAARAGTWSTAPWTGDDSSGISTDSRWAYHFGSSVGATIAGKSVAGLAGANPSAGNLAVTGVGQVYNNDANTLTASGGGSAAVARDFIWGGSPATVSIQGLTPGLSYVVTFLSVGWDAPGARQVTFSSAGDVRVVDQGQFGDNNGIRVDYSFTADASTRTITIAPVAATPSFTFHLYALALRTGSVVIGTDDFSYAGGVIVGQSGGSGWNRRNLAPAAPTAGISDWDATFGSPSILSGELRTFNAGVKREYNGPGEGPPATTDEGLGAIHDGSGPKSVYYQVTVTPGTGTISWGLSSFEFDSERVFFGVPAGVKRFAVQIAGGAPVLALTSALPERRYQLVARLDYAADRIWLYVNPDLSAPEAANTPAVTTAYTGTAGSTAVGLSSSGPGTVLWDNLVVATAWSDLQPVADTSTTTYRFNADTRQVIVSSGAVVSSVEGTPIASVTDMPDAVEFRFPSSVYFDPGDEIIFQGSKPVRLTVNGNVTIPAGMTVSATAGRGTGAPESPGGAGGLCVPTAIALGEITPEQFNITVDPLRAVGGAGGAGGMPAIAATAGRTGESSAKDNPEPLLSRGAVGLYGENGVTRPGGLGFGNPLPSIPPTDVEPPNGGPPDAIRLNGLRFWPFYGAAAGGAGGAGGAEGGYAGGGADGADGSPGAAGRVGASAGPGRNGLPGRYPIQEEVPLLAAGGGGSSGQGGGGGEGGGGGGAGGGGGGGGHGGTPFLGIGTAGNGGLGAHGGYGCFGGVGGDGGTGGAGGPGGGACEIRATGAIRVKGHLEAAGSPGLPGTTGTIGTFGEFPAYFPFYATAGVDGSVGENGATPGGKGGRGGNGGPGGMGGFGSAGGHGAGGAGGTIMLRATTVDYSGSSDVSGGAGAPGDAASRGIDGQLLILSAPGILLSKSSIALGTIQRGQSVPAQTFDMINGGAGNSTLRYTIGTLPFWATATPASGGLAGNASRTIAISLDTAILGGGIYNVPVVVSDRADPFVTPQTVMVSFTVAGPSDDYFGVPAAAELLPSGVGVTRVGNIDWAGDVDMFKIIVPQNGTLVAYTTGGTDTKGTLYAEDGTTVLVTNDDSRGTADLNFRLLYDVGPRYEYPSLIPRIYYLAVREIGIRTGQYQLHVDLHPTYLKPPIAFEKDSPGLPGLSVGFDTRQNTAYRLLTSTDLLTWRFPNSVVLAGDGAHHSLGFAGTLTQRGFFELIEGNDKPVLVARLRSSSSAANSAALVWQGSFGNFTIGSPANLGDTALLSNGLPLTQADGVTMVSVGKGSSTVLAAAPGAPPVAPLAGFPANGTWIATNGLGANNNEASGVNVALVHFPKEAGFPYFHFDGDDNGQFLDGVNHDPIDASFFDTDGTLLMIDNYRSFTVSEWGTRGAWLSSSTGDGAEPVFPAMRKNVPAGDLDYNGLRLEMFKPDGTRVVTPQSVVFIPYDTPGVYAGQVDALGEIVHGSGNFSMTLTAALRYRLTIPNVTDLGSGALLVTGFDETRGPCHFTWEIADGGLDIIASRAPLGPTVSSTLCGFYFAYFPAKPVFGVDPWWRKPEPFDTPGR